MKHPESERVCTLLSRTGDVCTDLGILMLTLEETDPLMPQLRTIRARLMDVKHQLSLTAYYAKWHGGHAPNVEESGPCG